MKLSQSSGSGRFYRTICAFLCLVIFWGQTWAQDFSYSSRKNIAIVGFQHGLHKDQESKVYDQVRSTLQGMNNFQVLDQSSVKIGIEQNQSRKLQNSSQKTQEAYENFVQGVESYRNLDLTAAIRDLNRAVKGYREGIASLEDNHYLLYSHLYLGMALYFDGRVADGEKLIREMVYLDPQRKTRKLPTRDFPPKIVELHKKESQIIDKVPKGTVVVDSNPSSAKVLLDGMDVGETPLTIHDIPAGQHFIAIDQAGHELYKQLIDVKQGEQNFIANLTPQKMFLAKNPFEQESNSQQTRLLQKIAKDLSVDYFILGQVEPTEKSVEMKLQSFDVVRGTYSTVYAKDLGNKSKKQDSKVVALTKDWADSLGQSATAATEFQTDFQEPTFKNDKPVKKGFNKKILWIGLGVVALGAGSYFLFSGGSDATSNVLSIDNPLN